MPARALEVDVGSPHLEQRALTASCESYDAFAFMTRAAVVDWAPRADLRPLLAFSPSSGVRQLARAASPPPRRPRRSCARRGQPGSAASMLASRRGSASGATGPSRHAALRAVSRNGPPGTPAVADLLDRAADPLRRGRLPGALVCAEEAARQAPRSVEAHHNRAVALLHLEASDEARDASRSRFGSARGSRDAARARRTLHQQLPPSADRSCSGSSTRAGPAAHAGRRQRPTRAARTPRGQGPHRPRPGRRGAGAAGRLFAATPERRSAE